MAKSPVAASSLRVIDRYPVGGNETGYDYLRLDVTARRLYVAHGNRVEVLDADRGTPIGVIGDTHGVHGIELIASLGKGYTSDGLDRAVTVFDLASLRVLHRIRYTGVKPDAIAYDPDTNALYVVNGGATGDVTVIDPATDAIVDTIQLGGGKLEQIGFDGRGHAFVNDEQSNVIHVFETHSRHPLARWSLAPCDAPTGMAVDAVHHRIFSACGNRRLAVVDSDDGHIVAMAPIGSDPDGAYFDAASQRIFTSNREGTLTVLHELSASQFEVVQTVPTERGARTLAFDPVHGRVFLPTAREGAAPAPGAPRPLIPESFVILVVGPSAEEPGGVFRAR